MDLAFHRRFLGSEARSGIISENRLRKRALFWYCPSILVPIFMALSMTSEAMRVRVLGLWARCIHRIHSSPYPSVRMRSSSCEVKGRDHQMGADTDATVVLKWSRGTS